MRKSREHEVMVLHRRGYSRIEIATRLKISPNTVKAHVANALSFRLGERQREVVKLVCAGMDKKEVAAKLGCAVKTVDAHLFAAYRILRVHNRVQLVLAWQKLESESRTEP